MKRHIIEYSRIEGIINELLVTLKDESVDSVALYGATEIAEVIIRILETDGTIKLTEVIDNNSSPSTFHGIPVNRALSEDVDRIIVCSENPIVDKEELWQRYSIHCLSVFE